MANSYFQFKKFRVNQEVTPMKVCTDACLFGACVPVEGSRKLLDIGAGTGLLSLMAAQRCNAAITAVEINKAAAGEAEKNIADSPFSGQIDVKNTSIQDYSTSAAEEYDLIISNPPFFKDNLHSGDTGKDQALHSSSLTFSELISCVQKLMAAKGEFWILLPPYEADIFKSKALDAGFHCKKNIIIHDRPGSKVLRHISCFTGYPGKQETSSFMIKSESGDYSPDFISLLKDYYLIF